MEREKRLIIDGSPCDVNYFNKDLLTINQAKEIRRQQCVNYGACKTEARPCTLRYGLEVAGYIIKGSSLQKELEELSKADFLDNEFWYSKDGKEFEKIHEKSLVLRAVAEFAKLVLLSDEEIKSCDKCNGIKLDKLVYDSIHWKEMPLAGDGRTKSRVVSYCPSCEPNEPRATIIEEGIEDEFEELRALTK